MQLNLSAADLAVIDKVLTSPTPPLPTDTEVAEYLAAEDAKRVARATLIANVRYAHECLTEALADFDLNGGGLDYVLDMRLAGEVVVTSAQALLSASLEAA